MANKTFKVEAIGDNGQISSASSITCVTDNDSSMLVKYHCNLIGTIFFDNLLFIEFGLEESNDFDIVISKVKSIQPELILSNDYSFS